MSQARRDAAYRALSRIGLRIRPAFLFVVLAAVGIVVLVILLGPVANWLASDAISGLMGKERADVIDATRQTVLQGAAGLLAIIALVFTARTYLLGREGQVTDRYTEGRRPARGENTRTTHRRSICSRADHARLAEGPLEHRGGWEIGHLIGQEYGRAATTGHEASTAGLSP